MKSSRAFLDTGAIVIGRMVASTYSAENHEPILDTGRSQEDKAYVRSRDNDEQGHQTHGRDDSSEHGGLEIVYTLWVLVQHKRGRDSHLFNGMMIED